MIDDYDYEPDSCYCQHTNPPCSYCETRSECSHCGKMLKHEYFDSEGNCEDCQDELDKNLFQRFVDWLRKC